MCSSDLAAAVGGLDVDLCAPVQQHRHQTQMCSFHSSVQRGPAAIVTCLESGWFTVEDGRHAGAITPGDSLTQIAAGIAGATPLGKVRVDGLHDGGQAAIVRHRARRCGLAMGVDAGKRVSARLEKEFHHLQLIAVDRVVQGLVLVVACGVLMGQPGRGREDEIGRASGRERV